MRWNPADTQHSTFNFQHPTLATSRLQIGTAAYRLAFEGRTGIPDFFDGDRKTAAYVEGYCEAQRAGTMARLAIEIERAEKEARAALQEDAAELEKWL